MRDPTLVLGARGLRGFCDGLIAVLLPLHFAVLGFSPGGLGLFASAALSGSALMTLVAGRYAGGIGYRPVLQGAAVLMFCSGAAFVLSDELRVLCAIAFVGTLNPSGGDVSVFVPIEHAVLAGSGNVRDRPGLIRSLQLCRDGGCGPRRPGRGPVERLAPGGGPGAAFVFYALAGALTFVLYRRLCPVPIHAAIAAPLGSSRAPIRRLAALFSLDSLAGGLVIDTLHRGLAVPTLRGHGDARRGVFLRDSAVLGLLLLGVGASRRAPRSGAHHGVHTPARERLAGRCGLRAGPRPHALAARPAQPPVADGRARAHRLRDVHRDTRGTPGGREPDGRAAQPGRGLSPGISGWLLGLSPFGWPLVLAGSMKIAYDLTLWRLFRHVEPIEGESTSRPRSTDSR